MEFSSGEFSSGAGAPPAPPLSPQARSKKPADSVIAVSTVFPLLVCFFVVCLFVKRKKRRRSRVCSTTDADVVIENISNISTSPVGAFTAPICPHALRLLRSPVSWLVAGSTPAPGGPESCWLPLDSQHSAEQGLQPGNKTARWQSHTKREYLMPLLYRTLTSSPAWLGTDGLSWDSARSGEQQRAVGSGRAGWASMRWLPWFAVGSLYASARSGGYPGSSRPTLRRLPAAAAAALPSAPASAAACSSGRSRPHPSTRRRRSPTRRRPLRAAGGPRRPGWLFRIATGSPTFMTGEASLPAACSRTMGGRHIIGTLMSTPLLPKWCGPNPVFPNFR